MKDIKLSEKCPNCGENITLMTSIRIEPEEMKTEKDGTTWLVKRCLKCGQYLVTEVAQIEEGQ